MVQIDVAHFLTTVFYFEGCQVVSSRSAAIAVVTGESGRDWRKRRVNAIARIGLVVECKSHRCESRYGNDGAAHLDCIKAVLEKAKCYLYPRQVRIV